MFGFGKKIEKDPKKALDNALSSPDADLKQKVVDFQETLLTAMEAMVTATDQLSGMPIVIVLDDIHWADQESIVILQALLKKASEKRWPLLFLATVWPAPWAERKPGMYPGRSALTERSGRGMRQPTVAPLSEPRMPKTCNSHMMTPMTTTAFRMLLILPSMGM